MSVRKRTWTTKGIAKEAWVVDYVDQKGKRHIETFARKKDADARHAAVKVDIVKGVHTADSASSTVQEAGELWLNECDGENLERTTIEEYRRHLNLHIKPHIGAMKLSRLTAPIVSEFRRTLRNTGVSPEMVKKVLTSLSGILAYAVESGSVAQNVVKTGKRQKRGTKAEQHTKLKVGVDIPTTDEIRGILGALRGRYRTMLMTAIFTGLRASELRGLRWQDIDFKAGELHVRQRADRYGRIGKPKSAAGERTVPLPPVVVNTLREWKMKCPANELDLAFPDRKGGVADRKNIVDGGLIPAMIAAGVCTLAKDKDGNPVKVAKYTGLHALRHFFASWCINRKADGGLELPPKTAQERLGHATIAMTMDTYGHLFPRGDDGAELAAAAVHLFG
jgi:integrase